MITDTDLIEYANDFLRIAHLEIEAKAKTTAVKDFYHKVKQCELDHL